MMAQEKQKATLLHELLKQDQEPFHLKAHISQKRYSLLKKQTISSIFCRHACFLKLHGSSDVTKSPFIEHLSPANKSPCCRSPYGAVFLHVPSRTASLLLEAALRIQKQQKPKRTRSSTGAGVGFFGSFLKKIKDRSKKRVISERDFKNRDARRVVRNDDDELLNCCGSHDDADFFSEPRFCVSPFVFSFRRSPLSSDGSTPELGSMVGSPSSHVASQENESPRNAENIQEAENEEKDQCSPVSVLDPPFEEEEEEADHYYNVESSYENVHRAKQQLLQRLRRFEKLAGLDQIELETKLLESCSSSDEESQQVIMSDGNERNHCIEETLKNEESNKSSHSRKMAPEWNKLFLDLIFVEKCEFLGNGEVGFDTIDAMIELDFKREIGGWKNVSEEVEETGIEVEIFIFDVLIEELSEEMY